jgi:hypothetical protein
MTRSDITLDEYLSELRADAKEYNRRFLQTKEVETSGEVKQRGLCKRSFPRYYVDVPEKEKGEMCFGKVTDSSDYKPAFYTDYRRSWEQHFKVRIPTGYHVHHKDKDRTNNNPVNLLCLPIEEHIKIHEINGDDRAVKMLRMM